MLTEPKFGITASSIWRYLIYAIGEIILVVIGILIALQVNNWNNQKQNDIKINNYINEIKNNLEIDAALIDSIVVYNDTKVKQLIKTVDFYYKMEDDMGYRDSILILASQGNIASFIPFKSNTTGLNALLGSGELNLISDSIRIKLNNYYDGSAEQSENNERTKTLTRNTVQDKIFKIIVTRESIELFTGLNISPKKGKGEKFTASDDIPMDLLFISEIEKTRNAELKALKAKGKALLELLNAQLK